MVEWYLVAPNEPGFPLFLPMGGRSFLGEAGPMTCFSQYNVVEEKLYQAGPSLKKAWQLLLYTLEEATHYVRSWPMLGLSFLSLAGLGFYWRGPVDEKSSPRKHPQLGFQLTASTNLPARLVKPYWKWMHQP